MNKPILSAPNRSINQIMNSEDSAGSFINKNKNGLIIFFILVVAIVIGGGIYSQHTEESSAASNSKIYEFQEGPLKKYTDTGADAAGVVSNFKRIYEKLGNYAGLFPIVIKLSDALIAHKNLTESLDVLSLGEKIAKNEYNNYFILARMAVVYEDLGQVDKAILTIEKMNSAKFKVFEGKNYVDLGRLYLKMGNKDKAKTSFQYVVDKAHDEAEFVKIAKLYLAKI